MKIVLENISKHYDRKAVFEKFHAEFSDNETVCIMGESGCGKTTLLHLICGLIKPDAGIIAGVHDAKISFVFQEDRLCENLTVYRNIKLVCKKIEKTTVEQAMEAVGLDKSLLYAPISSLSGGMKRRVAILRAILYDGDLLLLDEPTKGLDEGNKTAVLNFIKNNTKTKTVLWVTHDTEEAKVVADRILYL